MKKLFYNKQFIDSSDVKAVSKSLSQNLITGGKSVDSFETKLTNFLNVKYVSTCINGTAALHLAFEAINLKNQDIIIMPIINFIASYSMATLYNARIYFADVDKNTGQMTPETLVECIKKNKLKKIKAVVSMYLGGYPENIKKFYNLKKKYKFLIIEDACHAFGASYTENKKKYKIGSCKHADLSTFSFHPVKSITTGEGGAVTTNSRKFHSIISKFKNHNIVKNKNYWLYDIKKLGFNYRLSDLNCALGISQLKKINFFVKERKKIIKFYKKKLEKYSEFIEFPEYNRSSHSSYHLLIAKIKFNNLRGDKNYFFKKINEKNIFPQYHYIPLTKFKFKNKPDILLSSFSGANSFFKSSLSLPVFVKLNNNDLNKIITVIKNFFKKNYKKK